MNKIFLLSLTSFSLIITSCSTRGAGAYHGSNYSKEKSYSISKSTAKGINKGNYSHPTMRPYTIQGITYYPKNVNVGDTFKGNASWYGPDFHGKLTSNGETYNMHEMTAAHKTLPMDTIVRVTNLRNGLTVVVRINDRGPFVATRIIDLSNKAARKIKMIGTGTAPVKLEIVGFKSKEKRVVTKKHLGNYALQIASFSKIDGALKTQEKYDKIDGYETLIQDIESNSGRMFKVILKGFKSEEEAREYKTHSTIFNKAFIIRVKED